MWSLLIIGSGPTIVITQYNIQTVLGTGSININSAGLQQATGISTSAGATVVALSNIPGGPPQAAGGITPNLGTIPAFSPFIDSQVRSLRFQGVRRRARCPV